MAEENEIPLDVKNDVQLAFNLFKNEKNKVNKLKLRTILFSFVMYKFSASDINSFIENVMGDKELFSFEDVCDLVNMRLQDAKEREAEELFNNLENKNENAKLKKGDLIEAFHNNGIEVEEKEVDQMMQYMEKMDEKENEEEENQEEKKTNKNAGEKHITRDQFKILL